MKSEKKMEKQDRKVLFFSQSGDHLIAECKNDASSSVSRQAVYDGTFVDTFPLKGILRISESLKVTVQYDGSTFFVPSSQAQHRGPTSFEVPNHFLALHGIADDLTNNILKSTNLSNASKCSSDVSRLTISPGCEEYQAVSDYFRAAGGGAGVSILAIEKINNMELTELFAARQRFVRFQCQGNSRTTGETGCAFDPVRSERWLFYAPDWSSAAKLPWPGTHDEKPKITSTLSYSKKDNYSRLWTFPLTLDPCGLHSVDTLGKLAGRCLRGEQASAVRHVVQEHLRRFLRTAVGQTPSRVEDAGQGAFCDDGLDLPERTLHLSAELAELLMLKNRKGEIFLLPVKDGIVAYRPRANGDRTFILLLTDGGIWPPAPLNSISADSNGTSGRDGLRVYKFSYFDTSAKGLRVTVARRQLSDPCKADVPLSGSAADVFGGIVSAMANCSKSQAISAQERLEAVLEEGFRPLLGLSGHEASYGNGIYFTSSPLRPINLSGDEGASVILARVVLGDYCIGKPGMRQPPLQPGHIDRHYHSLVDRLEDPGVFVLQEGSSAYPAYCIRLGPLSGVSQEEGGQSQPSSAPSSHAKRKRVEPHPTDWVDRGWAALLRDLGGPLRTLGLVPSNREGRHETDSRNRSRPSHSTRDAWDG